MGLLNWFTRSTEEDEEEEEKETRTVEKREEREDEELKVKVNGNTIYFNEIETKENHAELYTYEYKSGCWGTDLLIGVERKLEGIVPWSEVDGNLGVEEGPGTYCFVDYEVKQVKDPDSGEWEDEEIIDYTEPLT